MLTEADLFDSLPPGALRQAEATALHRSLLNHVQRLGLDVDTIVPIHGQPVSWADFPAVIE